MKRMLRSVCYGTLTYALLGVGGAGAMESCCVESDAASASLELEVDPSTTPDVAMLSRAFGHLIGQNLNNPVITFQVDEVISGIRDQASGIASPITASEFERIVAELESETIDAIATENLKAAENFLGSHSSDPDTVMLEGGKVQYRVTKAGEGADVIPHTAPLVHYRGSCLDGTVFGNSEEVGGPVTIPLDQTIPGFQMAVLGMKVGERREIFVHPDLGYGIGGNLPPNSLLKFEVEIVETSPVIDDGSEMTAMGSETSGAPSPDTAVR